MKTLILTAALTLGSMICFAQEKETTTSEPSSTQTSQETQESFTEIKLEETPEVVIKALKKAYPNAVLDKVFVNDNKDYKLQITVADKQGLLYCDANGNWIQK